MLFGGFTGLLALELLAAPMEGRHAAADDDEMSRFQYERMLSLRCCKDDGMRCRRAVDNNRVCKAHEDGRKIEHDMNG
jgi:hypothetical protein